MKIESKIRTKLLLAIFIVLALVITVFSIFVSQNYRQNLGLGKILSSAVEDAEKEFNNLIRLDTSILESSLDVFLDNQAFKDVYLEKDRQALFELGELLFKKLKTNHEITHFYFHLPEGYNFLRLHNQDIFGDKINRFTFQQARFNQKVGSGIELGKTAFALRVVKPYLDNAELIGYVEFGKEIDNILNDIKSLTDKDLLLVVDKQFLSREDWQSVRQLAGLGDNWDDFEKNLIIDSTLAQKSLQREIIKECLGKTSLSHEHSSDLKIYQSDSRSFLCGEFHVYDAGDREVGYIIVLQDITEILATADRFDKILIIASILVYILVFIFYNFLVGRIVIKPIKKLHQGIEIIEQGNLNYKVGTQSKDEIGQLSQAFDKMTESIKKSRAEVDIRVDRQTKEITLNSKKLADQQKAILNILEDVEEEKELTAKERDKINTILYSIGDGVFVVDKNLKITMFNQVAADISGFSVKEAQGKKYSDILKFIFEDTKQVNDKFIKEAMQTGEIQEMANHTLLITKDKKEVPVADSVAPLKNKKGEVIGCVVVFRDVTRERAVDQAKTEFVSLTSHQLRTPLSAINWYAEMLLAGDAGKVTDEQKKYLEEIYQGNQRMVELVNALLNVSRLELGTFAIDPKKIDLIKIAKSAIDELKPQINKKEQNIKTNIADDLSEVVVDSKLVRIIFQNLLSNAVKYTPEKGKIGLKMEKLEDDLLIQITDNGMGIPKAQQSRMFEKLFRADNVREKDTEGTGLGLYIIKSILDNTDGKIWFESVEGKGTTFSFTIPLSGMKKKKGNKELN